MFCFGLVEGEFKELWLPLLLPGELADDFASTSSASCCALECRGVFLQGHRFCREHLGQAVTLSSRMCGAPEQDPALRAEWDPQRWDVLPSALGPVLFS